MLISHANTHVCFLSLCVQIKCIPHNANYISYFEAKHPWINTHLTAAEISRLHTHFYSIKLSYPTNKNMNSSMNNDDLKEGDTMVGTKDMVVAKIHALSSLQQKDVSASTSKPKKVSAVHVWLFWMDVSMLHSDIDTLIVLFNWNQLF